MIAKRDSPDRALPALAKLPTLSAEAKEPMLAIDSTEPTDPMDSTEPVEAMDSTESREAMLQRERGVVTMICCAAADIPRVCRMATMPEHIVARAQCHLA